MAFPFDYLAIKAGATLKLNKLTGFAGSWTTSDPSVATVGKKGVLTGVSAGDTTLTFTLGKAMPENVLFMGKSLLAGESVDIKLFVVEKGLAVNKVKIEGKTTVATGETTLLTAKLTPATAQYTDVFWRTNNPSVAVVDKNGEVKGIAPGKAKITAIATSGVTKTITVKVKK